MSEPQLMCAELWATEALEILRQRPLLTRFLPSPKRDKARRKIRKLLNKYPELFDEITEDVLARRKVSDVLRKRKGSGKIQFACGNDKITGRRLEGRASGRSR